MTITTKKISYLRALNGNEPFNLEEALRIIFRENNTEEIFQIEILGEIIQIIDRNLLPRDDRNNNVNGLLLHIGDGVRDERMRVMVSQPTDTANFINRDNYEPPAGYSFVKKEAFMFVSGEHVVFCSDGLRQSRVSSYFNQLSIRLNRINNRTPIINIDLRFTANYDMLHEVINRDGLKGVELGLSVNQQQATNYLFNNDRGVVHKIINFLNDIATDEENIRRRQRGGNGINTTIFLNLQNKNRATIECRDLINQVGELLVDQDDEEQDFKLITMSGQEIKPDEFKLSKTIYINRGVDGLPRGIVFQELVRYFIETRDALPYHLD